jgi:hypothetical protein
MAGDLSGDRLDLLCGTPGHPDVHARVRELARDVRADAAAAAGDQRDLPLELML